MTCKTGSGGTLGRVGELCCPSVAVHAAKGFVNALRKRPCLYSDGLALRVRQTRGSSVAGKAIVRGPQATHASKDYNDRNEHDEPAQTHFKEPRLSLQRSQPQATFAPELDRAEAQTSNCENPRIKRRQKGQFEAVAKRCGHLGT